MPTVLANFIQLPQEPTSGAARSMRTVCEFLSLGGWRVQVLGNTATEGETRLDAHRWLACCGIEPEVHAGPQSSQMLCFRDQGVDYALLDTGAVNAADARQHAGDAYDQLFDQLMATVQPDMFLTYGGWLPELERRRRARRAGIRVVFAIHNEAYMCPPAIADVDAVFSPGRYLAERYHSTLGVEVTPLPLPVAAEQVTAAARQPTFVTFINPEPIKGVAVFARIAEEISCRHPEIPFLVVKSRRGADVLIATALAGGFDLRRHRNIAMAEPVPDPRRIYGVTRVLLAPSFQEAAGRVAAEALLNGIPVIASDRGGLPETLNDGGFVLRLPAGMTAAMPVPPPAEAVQPWVALTVRLMTDPACYRDAVHRSHSAGRAYNRPALVSVFCNFFEKTRLLTHS